MKLTTVFIIAAFLQVSAASFAQTVTYKSKHASLEQIFTEIRKQTGFNVLVSYHNISDLQAQTVDFDKVPLKDVLDTILKDQPVTYEIQDKTILIKEKPQPTKILGLVGPRLVNITGTVVDSTGKPIQAATVAITYHRQKDSGNPWASTTTDEKGTFEMDDVETGNCMLTISFIGYSRLSKTIRLSGKGIISLGLFILKSEVSQLGEVTVNTGYQHIKAEQSTGSTAHIGAKQYASRMSTNFLDGLVGKLPGLVINNDVQFTSTDPSGNTTSRSLFNIRGISTMTANQSPLIVVDGYPTELSLNMINPNEIKSVTILKDAAAATIYGVRASNGVIIVERKDAKAGKPQIAFSTQFSFKPADNYSRYRWAPDGSAITVDYLQQIYKTSINADTWNQLNGNGLGGSYPSPYYIMAQQAANIISPAQANESLAALRNYNNSADYSRLFLRTATTQNYNLNMSGGSENALYYMTASYASNSLEQIRNGGNSVSLSGRVNLKFARNFTMELITDFQQIHSSTSPVPAISSIYPFERFQDASGNPASIAEGSGANPFYNAKLMALGLQDAQYYPLVDVNEMNDATRSISNRTTVNFDYRIGNGLDLTFGGIYEVTTSDGRNYASATSSQAHLLYDGYAVQNPDGTITFNAPQGGFLQQQTTSGNTYTARMQLNYNKKIAKDHTINGIVGAEVRDITTQGSSAAYLGYNDQTLLSQPFNFADASSGNNIGNLLGGGGAAYSSMFSQTYTDDRFISAYSNLVYSFRDKYSLAGSMRIDQSNLFGTDPKYKYKPLWSVSGGWNIDQEPFIKDVTWIKGLKLRLSDGFNGNVAKNSLPQVIASSSINTYTYPYSNALTLSTIANSGLRWEQTHTYNIGIDYQLPFHVSGSIDYYRKTSTDLMGSAAIDPAIGASNALINSASIRNQGVELSLAADWIATAKFNWNTGLAIGYNTSKVLQVDQNVEFAPYTLNSAGYVKGYPVGALFAYRWAGLNDQGQPQIRDSNGQIHVVSLDNPDVDKYISGQNAGTIRYMGSSLPALNVGLSNRLDIGNFYFYCMINYIGDFKVTVPRPDPAAVHPLAGAGNYWKKSGDELHTDIMSPNNVNDIAATYAYTYADSYVVNGDYMTLHDLTASYSFNDSKFFKKLGLSHFEVKFQASDVWTVGFNKYNYSAAGGSYDKGYITPTYTIGLFTNF